MLLQFLKLEFLWYNQKLVQVEKLSSCYPTGVLKMG